MTAILGISAFFHDAAAALVVDGRIVAAAQEERFSRVKHDPSFPVHAIAYCLEAAGLTPDRLDLVVFYDKPLQKVDRLVETYLGFAPRGFSSFRRAVPEWLGGKMDITRQVRRHLPGYRRRVMFTRHHEAHAASAFFPSPFDEAAILTVDGVGEWATASWGTGRGNRIHLERNLRFPHSLGLLYSAFTYHCGFRVNSGEYKLMGLAPYGEPAYVDVILRHLVDLKEDGSFRLDLSYFDYCAGLTMTSRRFDRLFGGPPRRPETPIAQRHMDMAASIQVVTEKVISLMARHVHGQTGMSRLCLAGGVALNCVANGRLLRDGPFDDLWIQPAAGDAGGALGAALFAWYQAMGHPRLAVDGDAQQGSLLGPSFDDDSIRAFLDKVGARYRLLDEDVLLDTVAGLLDDGKVVGWFQGRMEFGPRALGARSILGDARSPEMQSRMNRKIKFRESFRPFAPSVLAERVADWFDLPAGRESPYMLLTANVRSDRMRSIPPEQAQASGLDKLLACRSDIPAVTHVDGSARLQTVDEARHGRYWRLFRRFEERTGCPVLINTSFNVRGEPIVCRPADAWQCFLGTNMDVLVLERFLLLREDQPQAPEHSVDDYLARFQPD